jgi:hypothetical protein
MDDDGLSQRPPAPGPGQGNEIEPDEDGSHAEHPEAVNGSGIILRRLAKPADDETRREKRDSAIDNPDASEGTARGLPGASGQILTIRGMLPVNILIGKHDSPSASMIPVGAPWRNPPDRLGEPLEVPKYALGPAPWPAIQGTRFCPHPVRGTRPGIASVEQDS